MNDKLTTKTPAKPRPRRSPRQRGLCACQTHSFGGTYLELTPHQRIRYTDQSIRLFIGPARTDSNPCSHAAARFCQRIIVLRPVESTSIDPGWKPGRPTKVAACYDPA